MKTPKMQHFCIFFFILFTVQAAQNIETVNKAVPYLKQFGYMTANTTLSEAVSSFQKQAGLSQTGELNEATIKMMSVPRCGSGKQEEILRGVYQGSRWAIRNLTYNITDYPKKLEVGKINEAIRLAFNQWARISDFTFTKVNGDAHISIGFKLHPKTFPNLAGTAKYPVFGGDIEFNGDSKWSTDIVTPHSEHILNLFQIAVHEIGHSLGLLHSSYPDSIMTPFFTQGVNGHIHPSDRRKLRKLYNISNTSKSDLPKRNYTMESVCNLTKIDAIIAYSETLVYVFNEDKYWMLSAWTDDITFDMAAYPKKISDTWKGLPATIDSAFVDVDNATYFFKGSQCWKFLYGENTVAAGFPKSIGDEFPGIPNDIDAVLDTQENKTYFFKGSKYWGFMINEIPEVNEDYPKSISLWNHELTAIDAAIYFMSEIYFFKDMDYYRYEEKHNTALIRKFPRPTALWWFNC